MPTLIARPTGVQAAGNLPEYIEEYAARGREGDRAWGLEYLAVRLPSFASGTAQRDDG